MGAKPLQPLPNPTLCLMAVFNHVWSYQINMKHLLSPIRINKRILFSIALYKKHKETIFNKIKEKIKKSTLLNILQQNIQENGKTSF